MNLEEKYLFELLKKHIYKVFLKAYGTNESMEEWKGETIVAFQEDLFVKTKGKVSEKWFYTYIKKVPEKLPRIDILNLLSDYIGYGSWSEFKTINKKSVSFYEIKGNRKKWLVVLLFPLVFLGYNMFRNDNVFSFCFIDSLKNEIIGNGLNIQLIKESQSPIYLKTDTTGCFNYVTKNDIVKFIVSSAYYKTDTIIRHIDSSNERVIRLEPDDYSLMLYYYTNNNIQEWKIHKERLNDLISEDAIIYQLFQNSVGVEIYNKKEFIRTLTIPTKSLKRIKILDRTLKKDKILTLKYMLK